MKPHPLNDAANTNTWPRNFEKAAENQSGLKLDSSRQTSKLTGSA
jgi:hypothetical protein